VTNEYGTDARMKKGIIALDIDGTLTTGLAPVPAPVCEYLHFLTSVHWEVCLITGRGLALACHAAEKFSFSYHIAAQNGAVIVGMPGKKAIHRHYLEQNVFPVMEEICAQEPTDYIVCNTEDHCFYRPHCYDASLLSHIQKRMQLCGEMWTPVESFEEITQNGVISLKSFGMLDSLTQIVQKVESQLHLHFPIIRDPLSEGLHIAQGTHIRGSKGSALRQIKEILQNTGPVIAAGDDHNDFSLLMEADYRIAMEEAPDRLKKIATAIASSAKKNGVIKALEKAIEWYREMGVG